MSPYLYAAFLAVVLSFLLLIPIHHFLSDRRELLLPPGPPGYPLIGNISLLWTKKPWVRFTEWKELYGPIIHLKILGRTIIVLNTHEAAADLLERRSKIYNGRPRSILIDEMMTGGMAFPLVGYGHLWRRHRRAAHTVLNVRAVQRYHVAQEHQSMKLVDALLRDPADWRSIIKNSLFNLFSSVGYGENRLSAVDSDTEKVSISSQLEDFMARIVQAATPGSSIMDFIPVLAMLPPWASKEKRERLHQFQQDSTLFEKFLAQAQADLEEHDTGHEGRNEPIAVGLLGNQASNQITGKEAAWLTAVLCGVGAEVTSSVVPIFILAMTLYPQVQRCAQIEIDSVVGHDRYPSFQDQERMPYIQALVREVLRWRPIGPIGFPHSCIQDDHYKGYHIPAGSIVVPNIWAMNRDPQLYPDFDEFRPERFLNSELTVPGAHGQGHVSYGVGDRICSGMHITNDTLFITIASILHRCDILPISTNAGSEAIRASTGSKDVFDEIGVVTRPADFSCRISPRRWITESSDL